MVSPAPRTEALTEEAPGSWEEVSAHLAAVDRTYWLTVPGGDGVPHTRPLLAVWAHGRPYFACGEGTKKARLLAGSPAVSLTVTTGRLDVVVEGRVERVLDQERVREVAGIYPRVYGWPPVAQGSVLTGPDGAPTAGPPPYAVYGIAPEAVYAFPADDVGHGATRWRFTPGTG